MILLETTNLTKTYGTKTVVNDISLKIQAGQLVAFLGPNGAGKSTTIGMLTGLIQPSSGKITMGTATPNQAAYRQQIGVVFQDSRLDRQLTVKENLEIRSQMYTKTDPAWFDHLVDQFDLTPILNQAYGTLSGGQRRRVDIARALLNHPHLLFLDEPTTGLDIQTRQTIWTAIASLRAQSQLTVILTTHYLEETEQADFVYVIDQGTIIAANTVGQLKQQYAGHQLIVRTHAPQQVQIAATQANLPAQIDGDTVRVQVSHPQAAITLLTTIQPERRFVNMWAFVKRNLLLFFRNRAGVFFSVLGALIAFLLYLVFLKKSMSTLWPLTHPEKLLDPWLIGGTLTITAVTTTQNGLARMIVDRETGRLSDYLLTQASYLRIELGYLISAVIIGTIMQLLMFFTMSGAFLWLDHIAIFWQLTGQIIVLAVFSSLVWTAFNLLILSFVSRVTTMSGISTIIGTAAGFFAGVYLPIGSVPTAAQNLMKLTPFPYNAAIYRQLLLQQPLESTFSVHQTTARQTFEKMLGIRIDLHGLLSSSQTYLILTSFTLLVGLVIILIAKVSRKTALVRV